MEHDVRTLHQGPPTSRGAGVEPPWVEGPLPIAVVAPEHPGGIATFEDSGHGFHQGRPIEPELMQKQPEVKDVLHARMVGSIRYKERDLLSGDLLSRAAGRPKR